MAVVHEALDVSNGDRIALKRMRLPEGERKRTHLTGLFEREFLTLAQLAHPRIVAAYDYGLEQGIPYYTMELLDGGDLQTLAPISWRQACVLGRDVCSALSLLHSRRLVHRDLSPRNVRCTSDGEAKLIDFGAMAPMGPARELVGTPPFVAPEALDMQPLDGRTDLFSLGATLYCGLTGRQAFPARNLAQLKELWRVAPPPPSVFNAEVPEALDRLVLELMHLDPALRPANAAEVMLRLSTIADLPADEHLLVHQAYLTAPTLVARDAPLTTAREHMKRALAGRGASLLVHGPQGSGRSRFLQECALEAKLRGLHVLRVEASEVEEDAYGLARSLARQLLATAREVALEASRPLGSVLADVLPDLFTHERDIVVRALSESDPQVQIQKALKRFFVSVAQLRPLLIAVDNLARADEPSRGLLSIIAQDVGAHPIVLLSTLSSEDVRGKDRSAASSLLSQSSTALELTALDLEQTKLLLSSIFGDVPNLPALALYTEQISAGNPRDVMRLAQHLVDEQVIRFTAGSWSLPERLHGAQLPATMADALQVRVVRLSSIARNLAYAFAAEPKQRFTVKDCATLATGAEPAQLSSVLRELLDAGVIARAGSRYQLAQLGFAAPLEQALSKTELQRAHGALARHFERLGDGLRRAQHLLRAGDEANGLNTLLREAAANEKLTNSRPDAFFEVLSKLPHDWLSVYEAGLSLCGSLGRPERERDILLSRMSGYIAHAVRDVDGFRFLKARLDTLASAVGLDIHATLPSTLAPGARLATMFERAKARYEALPEAARTHEPGQAIGPLVTTVLAALGTISFTNDLAAFEQMPSLAPLVPLSPALAVAHETTRGVGARIQGRLEDAAEIYEKLLTRLDADDRSGLQAAEHRTSQLRVTLSLGALEAGMGLPRCLERAGLVEREPEYRTQGIMLRRLHQLWQGDAGEAARTQYELEQRRAFSNSHHGFDGQYLLGEICAHGFADDLMRVKQATDLAALHAQLHRGWLPVMHYGRGEHLRIRGDLQAALTELETSLALMREHTHQIWANAAGAHLRTLVELGRYEQAIEGGHSYLQHARASRLGYLSNYVRMPLSLAFASTGDHQRASEQADAARESFEQLGSTGLNLAAAYETCARVALEAGDTAGFDHNVALSLEQCPANRRLSRAKLSQAARRKPRLDPLRDDRHLADELSALLARASDDAERARLGLEFLSRNSEAVGGVLYVQGEQLRRVVAFGELPEDGRLDVWAQLYFRGQVAVHEAHTSELDASALPGVSTCEGTNSYLPLILGHEEVDGYHYTGLVVLFMPATTDLSWLSQGSSALSRSLFTRTDSVAIEIKNGSKAPPAS